MIAKQLLMWADVETSGLDPNRDRILEVSVSLADVSDPYDAYEVMTTALHFPRRLHESLDPWILETHTKSGLLAECERSTATPRSVEEFLLGIVPVVEDKELRPMLAGSTIHFDRGFLARYMPVLTRRLSHRHWDVSSLKEQTQSMGMAKIPKANVHRAAADVAESLDHGRQCFDWLRARR